MFFKTLIKSFQDICSHVEHHLLLILQTLITFVITYSIFDPLIRDNRFYNIFIAVFIGWIFVFYIKLVSSSKEMQFTTFFSRFKKNNFDKFKKDLTDTNHIKKELNPYLIYFIHITFISLFIWLMILLFNSNLIINHDMLNENMKELLKMVGTKDFEPVFFKLLNIFFKTGACWYYLIVSFSLTILKFSPEK